MKTLFFCITIIISLTSQHLSAANFQAIKNSAFEKDTPEHFFIEILRLASQEKYLEISKHHGWTWTKFYSNFDDDYAWRRVVDSGSIDEIKISNARKSALHKNLYKIAYAVPESDGRLVHSSASIVKEGDTFKLAVQPNGNPMGSASVRIDSSLDITKQTLDLMGLKQIKATENAYTYQLVDGNHLVLKLNPEGLQVSAITVVKPGIFFDDKIKVYMVSFDPEKSYSIKVQSF